jgi:hypothetical protein
MDIEFPVGTKFGVEKTIMPSTKKKGGLVTKESLGDGGPTRPTLDQSNRELRRLFVEMFQPVGGDRIVVAFVDDTLADAAKQQWKGDPESSCRIMAMNRRSNKSKTKKKATQTKGFAAKMAAEVEGDDDSSRHAYVGQGQDPWSRCPVGILNVGGGQVPLACTSVGIPTAIPEDHRQALMGQGHVPLIRCNPAYLLNMGKGQAPLSCTSIGTPIAILREHRQATLGQGQDPSSRCPVGILNVGGGQVPLSCTSVGILV